MWDVVWQTVAILVAVWGWTGVTLYCWLYDACDEDEREQL